MTTRYKYSDEQIRDAVANSGTWKQVCAKISAPLHSRQQTHIRKRAEKAGIDFSHFKGRAWGKGKRFPRRKVAEFLTLNGPEIITHRLKIYLIREGIKNESCEICGIAEWMGQPIPIQLDHKNGNSRDNRIENLRTVCPNCHSQTVNYAGRKNKGSKRHWIS